MPKEDKLNLAHIHCITKYTIVCGQRVRIGGHIFDPRGGNINTTIKMRHKNKFTL